MSDKSSQQKELVQALFLKHSSLIKGFILALYPDFSLTDDLLHEVFLIAAEKANTFEVGTSFVSWACAIARLKILEACRERKRQGQSLSPEVVDALAASAPCERLASLTAQRKFAIDACLQNLAPRARSIVEMRYQQACRPDEIAKRLSWTADSVNVALSKARAILRECVERRLRAMGEA